MDEDYFETFSPEEISTHIRMSSKVDSRHRVRVGITSQRAGEFDIVIVGYDYLSEFSIFCGLLSAFGLDIQAGEIYSFSKQSSAPLSGRIVDVLRVALKPGEIFDEKRQCEFESELGTLAELLAAGSLQEARERLNRFLIEQIERMDEALAGLLSPVELHFDNRVSNDWTLMEARSQDSFGFLYAISNALAMRGIYIHRVKIQSAGGRVTDHFLISNRWGRKIEDSREQERLRMAVSLTTRFTSFLHEAPDPARALRHFDQLLDKLIELSEDRFPDQTVAFLAGPTGMNTLAHLLGSSNFLWDDLLRIHFSYLLPVLEGVNNIRLQPGNAFKAALREEFHELLRESAKSGTLEDKKRILNVFKDRHVFRIDIAHLLQPNTTLLDFSYALTDLGEFVLEEAANICHDYLMTRNGQPLHQDGTLSSFAIFGLGKFGGREMGYASDFELLFVHEISEKTAFFESFARLVVDFIEARSHGIFHIDLRLRPYGDAGAWSTPFEQFTRYYSEGGEAAPFERQALIKLRWVAGNEPLGRRVEAHRDRFTYGGASWDWADAMQLRRRQIKELVKTGQTNVKYSAGGIVDIEYAIQYLQLLNGAEHPEIRLSNTLDALQGLRRLQVIREADYATLHDAYLFLRRLIDGLRIVRGDATDLVLPDEQSEEYKSLARRMGYRDRDRSKGAALLAADIQSWMNRVHEYFVMRFDFER
jgi:[glutamine synthetase] adenylyltransferase / [glutamine synthetase]-adenylyl-L-tyrosine phosphorylase